MTELKNHQSARPAMADNGYIEPTEGTLVVFGNFADGVVETVVDEVALNKRLKEILYLVNFTEDEVEYDADWQKQWFEEDCV